MDTSETYIKMCDCPEVKDTIQKIIETDHRRKVETRKRFADTEYSVRIPDIRTPDVSIYDADGSPMRRIDLLSQDQIQEMLLQYYGLHSIVKKFWEFEQKMRKEENVGIPSESMEQLWLAFYMHEKHGKIWNGKEWEKKA